MKYTIESIRQSGNTDFLFFWGHQPSKDGSIIKTCMSQWWPAEFEEHGIIYKTAEHYMMAMKAKLFQDENIFEKIVSKTSPKDVKDLGRQIKNFDPEVWDERKYNIVKGGNYHKFSQNKELLEFIRQTRGKVLVEASPVDRVWGIGLAEEDPNAKDPAEWKGENL
jgi:ribA/ribD-fused uncharacterized protein